MASQEKEKRRNTTIEVKKLPKDSTFYVLGVVSKFVQRKDKNDNPFWDITIMDGEGQIDGKIWGNSEWWDLSSDTKRKLDPLSDQLVGTLEGHTVGIQGKIVEFREQNQCNFNAVYFVDQAKYPPHGFVTRSPFPLSAMEPVFKKLLGECGEPVKGFLDFIFYKKNVWQDFSTCPAAVSLHHAYVGGLLEHSLSVARSALAVARGYLDTGFPVSLDTVIAGGLLHDLGKIETYRLTPAPAMTLAGSLADHIMIGYHNFMDFAAEYKLDEDYVLSIGHIIVSHHGSREFGSPVLPATPEAMIVSAADDLDFKMNFWQAQTSQLDSSRESTDFVPLLQRRFWRGRSSVASKNKKAPTAASNEEVLENRIHFDLQ